MAAVIKLPLRNGSAADEAIDCALTAVNTGETRATMLRKAIALYIVCMRESGGLDEADLTPDQWKVINGLAPALVLGSGMSASHTSTPASAISREIAEPSNEPVSPTDEDIEQMESVSSMF